MLALLVKARCPRRCFLLFPVNRWTQTGVITVFIVPPVSIPHHFEWNQAIGSTDCILDIWKVYTQCTLSCLVLDPTVTYNVLLVVDSHRCSICCPLHGMLD